MYFPDTCYLCVYLLVEVSPTAKKKPEPEAEKEKEKKEVKGDDPQVAGEIAHHLHTVFPTE